MKREAARGGSSACNIKRRTFIKASAAELGVGCADLAKIKVECVEG